MANSNLRDGMILRDFTVRLKDVQKIGTCPQFTPPEINLEMEDFRGGGMFGTVEIPMGLEKMECGFDLHTWDDQIWQAVGFGAGSMNVPLEFLGGGITPTGGILKVEIAITGCLKSIKTDSIEPGKKVKMACMMAVNTYVHVINGTVVHDIDVFNNTYIINGQDVLAATRAAEGFTY